MMLVKFKVSFSNPQIHFRYSLLFVIFCCAAISFAQTKNSVHVQNELGIPVLETLLNISNAERAERLVSFYYNASFTAKDTTQLESVLKRLENLADKEGDKNLGFEVIIMRLHYLKFVVTNTQFEQLLKNAEIFADKSGSDWFKAFLKYRSGHWFLRMEDNPSYALYLFLQAEDLLENLNEEILKQGIFHETANMLYGHQDFKNAILYFKKQSRVKTWHSNNNVGVCFLRLGNLDSSNYYFNRALENAFDVYDKDSTAYYVIKGNLGENLFKQKKYKEAIPLMEDDVKISKQRFSWGNASNSLLILAEIYLNLGEHATSNSYLIDGRNNARLSQDYKRLKPFYVFMLKRSALLEDAEATKLYADSVVQIQDSLHKIQESLNFELVAELVESEKTKNLLAQEEFQNAATKLRITLIVLVSALIAFALYIVIRVLTRKNRQLEIENRLAQTDLEEAKKSLDHFVINIASNVDAILTEKDWAVFKKRFSLAFPETINMLNARFKKLTSAELRYMCLIKLDLANKEIASVLGIGLNGVQQINRRIKRKYEIETTEELLMIIRS